jgi:cytochrome c oxidase accessory protein FixG
MTKPNGSFRDSLRTIDSEGNRNWVYAEIMDGLWRRRRQALAVGLLAFFAACPWITVHGHPLMQVDVFSRKLILFGTVFWAHELGIFITAVLGVIIGVYALTAWGGRVFCGWFCPHSTWLEMIFRPIEQLIEGRANLRRQRDEQSVSGAKILRKTAKWAAFAVVSLLMAANCVGWVVSGHSLLEAFRDPSQHVAMFLAIAGVGGAFLFDFGWFREQTCLIVCPYGRLQGVLLDPKTLIVGYDQKRGEPRGRLGTEGAGDCVACTRCVQVCPTGIDIRDGLQLECIGCTACIDACDDMMLKVGKEKGLIRYTTEAELSGEKPTLHWRPILYMAFAFILVAVSVARVAMRTDYDVTLMRQGMANFTVSGGVVQNYLTLRVDNKTRDSLTFHIVSETPGVDIYVPVMDQTTAAGSQPTEIGLFVRIPQSSFHDGSSPVKLRVEAVQGHHRPAHVSFEAFGPEN